MYHRAHACISSLAACAALIASTATGAPAAPKQTTATGSWYLYTTTAGYSAEPTLERDPISFGANSETLGSLVKTDGSKIAFVDTDCSTKITPAVSAAAGCAQAVSFKIEPISNHELRYIIRNDGPEGIVTINIDVFAPKLQVNQSDARSFVGNTIVIEIPSEATSATAVGTYAGKPFLFRTMTVMNGKRRCNPKPPGATLVNEAALGDSADGAGLVCQFAFT